MELQTVNWQVPRFESSPSTRVGWVEEQIQEGEGFLEGQSCYRNLGANLRVFDAVFRDKSRSSLITNELKYDIRKFCETLAEVREIAGYGSDFPAYKQVAEMLTKVSKCIYLESDFPVQIPRSNDVQDAYAVTVYDYMPIAEAHGRFPLFQGQLQTVGPRSYKTQVQARR